MLALRNYAPAHPPPRRFYPQQQYASGGKAWGSTVAESGLSVQWYVEKTLGNMGGSLAQLCRRIERREERRERRRRAPEMEGESVKIAYRAEPNEQTANICLTE